MEAKLYKPTLYQQVRKIESIDEKLRGIDSSSEIDVLKLQRNLFGRYEENPVLYDAIQGKQTIGESIEELSQINKGIRKILPWRVNEGHNKRLKQLGELVSEPLYLHTGGIFCPDNLITAGAAATALIFGFWYLISSLLTYNPEFSSLEEFQRTLLWCQVIMPRAISVVYVPIGALGANWERFKSPLPKDEAKYLDEKVIKFYK